MKATVTGAALCLIVLVGAAGMGAAGAAPRPGGLAAPAATRAGATSAARDCPGTGPGSCLLPFPDDRLTRADPSTPTGRRLNLPTVGMPVNVAGTPIDPTEWNRNDGFSPSSIGLAMLPNLDLAASRLPPQTDIARSLARASTLVVVDVNTRTRIPAWAELDPRITDPTQRLLRIVPAIGLPEGHRIAIGLRGLRTTDGSAIARSPSFARLLAHPTAAQRPWLAALVQVGMPSVSLTQAWSFTVASEADLSGRLRHMWSETSAALGDGAPSFVVTSTQDAGTARVVRGTFQMPRYLQGDGGPGTVFNNDGSPNGIPRQNGTMSDDFVCTVPKGARAATAPFVLYGHGLLGSRNEALAIGGAAAGVGVGFCAVDELGMSASDIPTVLRELSDLSMFRTQADRLQQGQLGFLELGRLLASKHGFATNPAFQDANGASIIDPTQLALLGASQGGILGGAASAVTKDWKRVILAVGGMGLQPPAPAQRRLRPLRGAVRGELSRPGRSGGRARAA